MKQWQNPISLAKTTWKY